MKSLWKYKMSDDQFYPVVSTYKFVPLDPGFVRHCDLDGLGG